MRISIITINYPPEIGGAAHLIHDLALDLKERNHDVTVLTAYPHYNVTVTAARYQHGLRMDEVLDGIPLRRVRVPLLPRESKIARGLQHLAFGLWLSALAALGPRADVMLVFSPPLPLPWLVSMVGRALHIPVVVNVQDLFPKEAVELGMLTNRTLIRLFEGMERQMHRLATAVTVHSPGNRQHVIESGGQPDRVHVVYNWINTDRIRPDSRDNDFAQKHGLRDRFVVSYAGTMGWAQDMETIISSAARLRGRPDILFLLVGDGVEKEKAQARSTALGLENILWLPMQPWAVYPKVLAASDVSLINLNPALRTPVVPSKLLSIMAAARPVIASLPAESDARSIVTDAGCGVCVDAGDDKALAQAILSLYNDRARSAAMGRDGRRYVEARFNRRVCTDRMEAVLRSAAGGVK